jgi:hypothetical protein
MTIRAHLIRLSLLMAGVAALLLWLNAHAEVTFADGLRSIQQAERLDQGDWRDGVIRAADHPLHPLVMVACHRLLGGTGPIAWQHAAQVASILALALLVVPLYLVALEVYDASTAWVGTLLFFANSMTAYVAVNVLSETTFLLFWTWGLWGAIRYLREGRLAWLPVAIGFGTLAYLARPDGLLLPLALVATLFLSPWHWATRLPWPRWWAAMAVLLLGPLLLIGPYMVAKGGVGTNPTVSRLIGTAPALALDRDKPLHTERTVVEQYWLAFKRVQKVLRRAVTIPLLPFAVLGIMLAGSSVTQARSWLLQGIIVFASVAALVRMHATGGYCMARHALVPGMLLILAAAHGLTAVLQSAVIDGRWFRRSGAYYRLGPIAWAIVLAALILPMPLRAMPVYRDSFASYHSAGDWIARETDPGGQVLDVTDWSLFFSGRSGYRFADLDRAATDPHTRWVVVRDSHIAGHFQHSAILRDLVCGLMPVAAFPDHPVPGQFQVQIYDRRRAPIQIETALAPGNIDR